MDAFDSIQVSEERRRSELARNALVHATTIILKPLARLLLRHGITFQVFALAAKRAFVQVSKESFSIPGKMQSKSRIALLTGLTRPDVHQVVKDMDRGVAPNPDDWNRAAAVLAGWQDDATYCDAMGRPLILTTRGQDCEFAALVRKYGSDVPKAAVLDELKRQGCVEVDSRGRARLVRKYLNPDVGNAEALRDLGETGTRMLHTLCEGVYGTGNPPHREVFTKMPPALASVFRQKCQGLLERQQQQMQAIVRSHQGQAPANHERTAGVGYYYFEE